MAGLSSPDQRQFTGTDLLVHGRAKEVVDPRWHVPIEDPIARAISLGNELAGVKAAQGGGEVLASLERKKRSSFDLSRQTALRTRFGAGRAEVNTVGGIKLDTADLGTDKAIVEANSKSAERVIGQVSSVLNYTEILLESKKTGKAPDVILAERKINGATWDNLRNAALDAMLDSDAVRELVPDLSSQLPSRYWERDFIEQALASDPALHSKIAEKMIAIEARTREFTSSTTDGELVMHQETSKISRAAMETSAREAVDKMVAAGLVIPDADVQAQAIQKMLETGTNPDQIPAQILTAVRAQQLAARPDMAIVESYYVAKQKYDALLPRMKGIKGLPAAAQVRLQAEFDKADADFTAIETSFSSLSDPTASEQSLIALNGLLSTKSENGIYASPIAQDLAGGVAARKRMTESEQAYKKKAIAGREREGNARSQRLAEESDVIADMESILSEAIGDVLSERLAEMKRLDAVAQQKRAEQLEETGNKDQAMAVKKVGGIMESKWSSLDPVKRTRMIDRDRIGSDVRRLAYEGQDGLRALIREDLVSGGIVMIDGKGVTVAKATPEEHKRIDELVESVYQQEGHAYAKRLFADFVEARSIGDSRSKDIVLSGKLNDLGLKDHEWGLLAKNFEGMIDPKVVNSPEGKRLMEQMQKEGIDLKGNAIGFLAMLLFMLGGAINATASAVKKP